MVEQEVEASQNRKLWLRVIQQAVAEAEGLQLFGVEEEEREGCVYRAKKWLSTCTRSLQRVGFLAGLSGEQVKLLVEQNKRKYGF